MYKKALSLALVLVMLFTFVPAQALSTATSTETFEIQVTVNVTGSWNNGYNADCIITNTGSEAITDWVVGFDLIETNRITNLWNGTIVSNGDGEVIVRNAGWNANIPVGGSVSFGFTSETNGEMNLPDNFDLCERVRQEVSTAQAEFVIYSDWGTGFNGAIRITNYGTMPLDSWIVDFVYSGQFNSVSSGTLIGQDDAGRWAVTDAGWNAVLQAGSSTDVQVLGEGDSLTISDFKVYTTAYVRMQVTPNPEIDNEYERVIIIDSPEFYYSGGWYDVEDAVYNIVGRFNCNYALQYVTYTLESYLGTVSGSLPANKSWIIPDVLLGYELNELTFTLVDKSGNEQLEKITIINYNTDRLDNNDDDNDGLSNWLEDYLGTDRNNSDTDGDGLPDGYEYYVTVTNPLLYDSDGNGISDGDEDFDGDRLTNYQEYLYGTDPFDTDTDGDGLSDYEEIFVYFTDPLLVDSDDDGLPDSLELKYVMNPRNPDTLSDGILDGDRIFTVSLDGAFSDNGQVKPILTIDLQGDQIESLDIQKVSEEDFFLNPEIPGYLGNAFDFNVNGDFDKATLTFDFDAALLRDPSFIPAIYYWDEEEQFLFELPDQTINGNSISVDLEHFSTYMVMATNIYKESLFRHKLAKELIDKLGDDDRVSVVNFGTSAVLQTAFTSNKTTAKKAVDTYTDGGTTALYNAIDVANKPDCVKTPQKKSSSNTTKTRRNMI